MDLVIHPIEQLIQVGATGVSIAHGGQTRDRSTINAILPFILLKLRNIISIIEAMFVVEGEFVPRESQPDVSLSDHRVVIREFHLSTEVAIDNLEIFRLSKDDPDQLGQVDSKVMGSGRDSLNQRIVIARSERYSGR